MYRIGIDVGGTFTDVAAVDDSGRVVIAKSASTPADPSRLVDAGALASARPGSANMLAAPTHRHGTTVAPTRCSSARSPGSYSSRPRGMGRIEMRDGLTDDRYNLSAAARAAGARALRLCVLERVRFDGA